jgi:hypothetical protein
MSPGAPSAAIRSRERSESSRFRLSHIAEDARVWKFVRHPIRHEAEFGWPTQSKPGGPAVLSSRSYRHACFSPTGLCNPTIAVRVNIGMLNWRVGGLAVGCAIFSAGLFSSIDRNVSAAAQQGPFEYARVEHSKGSATLSVLSYGRPLLSGLAAVRAEYGWHLDLEQGTCDEPRGAQTFETTFPEDATLQPARHAVNSPPIYVYSVPTASEAGILNKIVADYNQTGPACQYLTIGMLRRPGGGRSQASARLLLMWSSII